MFKKLANESMKLKEEIGILNDFFNGPGGIEHKQRNTNDVMQGVALPQSKTRLDM